MCCINSSARKACNWITDAPRIACTQLVFIPDEMYGHESWSALESDSEEKKLLGLFEASSLDPKWSVKTIPRHRGRRVTVALVTYYTDECLACLALLYEVLLGLTEKKFVWLLKPNVKPMICECVVVMPGTFAHHLYSLRPISSIQVESHLKSWRISKGTDKEQIPSASILITRLSKAANIEGTQMSAP